MKKVIGIIGPLGAGKDTAAEYIAKKLGIPLYQISDKLKELAQEVWTTREWLIAFSRNISEQHGDGYLAQEIVTQAPEPIIVIAGMRQLWQIEYLQKNCDFTLIAVDADPAIRFERTIARQKAWDPTTLEQFVAIEQKEDGESVQKISACMTLANIRLSNEGTLDMLYTSLDSIIGKMLSYKKDGE